ncbi:MAG: hypothetical protein KDC38_16980, partial [Planctomycetes bacterium]|nr:hypothetical protein [Planctomycetota bacterium]
MTEPSLSTPHSESPSPGRYSEREWPWRLHPSATSLLIIGQVALTLAPAFLGLVSFESLLSLIAPLGPQLGASLGGGASFEEPWRLASAT